MIVQRENDRNGWEMSDNFENKKKFFFNDWKKTFKMGRSRTVNERNEKKTITPISSFGQGITKSSPWLQLPQLMDLIG